jgi:hypothetical protein
MANNNPLSFFRLVAITDIRELLKLGAIGVGLLTALFAAILLFSGPSASPQRQALTQAHQTTVRVDPLRILERRLLERRAKYTQVERDSNGLPRNTGLGVLAWDIGRAITLEAHELVSGEIRFDLMGERDLLSIDIDSLSPGQQRRMLEQVQNLLARTSAPKSVLQGSPSGNQR